MNEIHESSQEALFAFVEQFCVDAAAGAPPPLSRYLERFPGHELEIATEYLHLVRGQETPLDARPPSGPLESSELWRHLETRRDQTARYRIASQIARGGMGTIHQARDVELDRDVALKLVRQESPRALERLLQEARITGRLDHPGVVPVHDLGLDGEGRLFFSMRLVAGRDLAEVIGELYAHNPDWTLARGLEVLVKVCDTMAFAHSRGIVHRDLKPANVRVGEFGEVVVLDWGLARDLTQPPGSKAASQAPVPSSPVPLAAGDSPHFTLEGDVLGTPYYMPPEQARGELATIDARADVYATGAMLYHLLAGRPPYSTGGTGEAPRDLLERVRQGPPPALESLAPNAPRELLSICHKAMQRDPGTRYADMREFGRDLRAFLDRRVVSAHESGAIAELRAWARRNRALAGSIGALFLLAVWGAWMQHRSDVEEREHLGERLALQGREQADLALFQDVRTSARLFESFEELWPVTAAKRPRLEDWLADAERLVLGAAERRAELSDLRLRALPLDPEEPAQVSERELRSHRLSRLRDHRDYYEREMLRLSQEGGLTIEGENLELVTERYEIFSERLATESSIPIERRSWLFASARDQTRHDLCLQFLAGLESLQGPNAASDRLALVRAALAEPAAAGSASGSRTSWSNVREALASPGARLIYGELELAPQSHLVPLGPDPDCQLLEFACELTGSIPERAHDGTLLLDASSAIVLVLIPGGWLTRGAQALDPAGPNFDPQASFDEQPVERLPIDSFLLSKFELTRAQWQRIAGSSPWIGARDGPLEDPSDRQAPAGSLTWNSSVRALAQVFLELPTEAQWEWAARAGGPFPWSSSDDPLALTHMGNVYDLATLRTPVTLWPFDAEPLPADDGATLLARVGSYCPNAFGLYDTLGNVGEYCRDRGALAYAEEVALGSLERAIHAQGVMVWRGGCFSAGPRAARVSARQYGGPDWFHDAVGIRPARAIQR